MNRLSKSIRCLAMGGVLCLVHFAVGQETESERNAAALRSAFSSTDANAGFKLLESMPMEQRFEWLSEFQQSKSYGSLESQNGPAGGGAIANYTDLMNLISSTITPDSWDTNGGTSTMTPFRQGVKINPAGVVQRVDPNEIASIQLRNKQNPIVPLDRLGAWQEPSDLRWVSLNELDRLVADRIASGKRSSIAMELLGGIVRIDYVALDPVTNEWMIGGPAGDIIQNAEGQLVSRSLRLPPVLLEDLLTIAPHILSGRGELGCSIDPVKEKLESAYQMASRKDVQRKLQSNPEQWVEEWRNELGNQKANVVGIPQDSPSGLALLIADAHMKRLGLGLESAPFPVRSYWQLSDSLNQRIDQGLVRWWFTLSDARIPMDPERKIYKFEYSNVKVLSEAQFINEQGQRVVASSPDIAADAFAKAFSQNFDLLSKEFTEYGRLRHIFDLSIALELVRANLKQGIGKEFNCLDDRLLQPHLEVFPREMESIAATHRSYNGTVFAVVSGGVTIHPAAARRRLTKDLLKLNPVVVRSGSSEVTTEPTTVSPFSPKIDEVFWR